MGRGSAFDSKINCLFLCLRWSIKSGAKRYQKTFTLISETSSKSRQTNVFDRTYVLGAGKNLDLRMIFPIGSPMTVFYNQSTHRSAFVERYAGLVGFYKIGMILTVGIYLGLVCILALLGLNCSGPIWNKKAHSYMFGWMRGFSMIKRGQCFNISLNGKRPLGGTFCWWQIKGRIHRQTQ